MEQQITPEQAAEYAKYAGVGCTTMILLGTLITLTYTFFWDILMGFAWFFGIFMVGLFTLNLLTTEHLRLFFWLISLDREQARQLMQDLINTPNNTNK